MIIYSIAISFYNLAIFAAKSFNKKAALLYNGRLNTGNLLGHFKRDKDKRLAWFHCASLGEFEQARPLIERLKSGSDIQVAVSFFSPSGYEVRKNYDLADVVFYLPSDSVNNAEFVLDALKPDLVFFVKYEIWIHYINAISQRNISLYLLSATFRPDHIYFKWYGAHLKKALQRFDVIFTQDHRSLELLRQNNVPNAVFSNDTRYDRVYQSLMHAKDLPLIDRFKGSSQLLVLGSSYETEESFIADLLTVNPLLKVIVAPHNINQKRISEIENAFSQFKTCKYSDAENTDLSEVQILIIDNIGLLSSIYKYADVALIGGGFGTKGIHNTLEAATFGMPVFIGPDNHERFPETILLKEHHVMFTVRNKDEFVAQMNRFLTDKTLLKETGNAARKLIEDNTGATDLIIDHIKYKA